MSKGTIRGTPGATTGHAVVVVNDDTNFRQVTQGTVLKFGPKNPPDPNDVYPGLKDGDYIEFTITSVQSCTVTKKIPGKGIGIVRDALINAGEEGTLMVTMANKDTGVTQTKDMTFTNNTGVALKQNDFVEFENVIVADKTCDAVRRIPSIGDISEIPVGGGKGLIMVDYADANNSGVIDKNLNFQLPFLIPPPTVFNLRDTVEINIMDSSSCVYVQLLSPSAT